MLIIWYAFEKVLVNSKTNRINQRTLDLLQGFEVKKT